MVLVTGGAGFIGSHLVEALRAQGETVRCLLRRNPGSLIGYEAVYGDLVSGAGLDEALQGVETVIHVAGVTKAFSTAEFYAGNARASENLARAVAKRDIRLVHVSSLAAMGPSLDGLPIAEDASPQPVTHYGKSKLEAERLVLALAPNAVIARPPVVYGPRDTDVFQFLRSVAKGLVLQIGAGERWFSAIYVKDLVAGLLAAVRVPLAKGRAYFLANAKVVSWSELGGVAARVMGSHPRVLRIPASVAYAAGYGAECWSRLRGTPGIVSREKVKEGICSHWTCQTQRAAQELGFEARTTLEAGIAETLAWYKEAGWLKY